MPLPRVFVVALIPGVVIAFGLYLATLGPRPHLFGLLGEPRFLFKFCLALLRRSVRQIGHAPWQARR